MSSNESREYRPELIPRRGEILAWTFAIITGLSLVLLGLRSEVPPVAIAFVAFLLLAAMSISLGNWMDRHTVILVDSNGISFTNGVRKVRLNWRAINKVRILPARWGKSIQVLGQDAHFEFNTIGEVKFQGEIRGRVGFAKGAEIKDLIVRNSGLVLEKDADAEQYYARH